jgi:hypothetical protein
VVPCRTPDDGRKEHPKHVEETCSEIRYRLLSAASCWKLIYIRSTQHSVNVNLRKTMCDDNHANYTDSLIRNRRLNFPMNYLDAMFGAESRRKACIWHHYAALQYFTLNKELRDN